MTSPTVLKVILGDNSSQRLTLCNGLPECVKDLGSEVEKQCGLNFGFRLQFMDPVLVMISWILLQWMKCRIGGPSEWSCCAVIDLLSHLLFMKTPPACLVVVSTWTYYLHQNQTQSAQRHFGLAPSVFLGFALMQNSNLRAPSHEGLVQEIVRYRVYVTDKQFDTVGKALISKHPFLTERGSLTWYAGWKASLKNKLAIYCTHLRKLGCREVTVNSMKNKPAGCCYQSFWYQKTKAIWSELLSPLSYWRIWCEPWESESGTSVRSHKDKQQGGGEDENGKDFCISKIWSGSRCTYGTGLRTEVCVWQK